MQNSGDLVDVTTGSRNQVPRGELTGMHGDHKRGPRQWMTAFQRSDQRLYPSAETILPVDHSARERQTMGSRGRIGSPLTAVITAAPEPFTRGVSRSPAATATGW